MSGGICDRETVVLGRSWLWSVIFLIMSPWRTVRVRLQSRSVERLCDGVVSSWRRMVSFVKAASQL